MLRLLVCSDFEISTISTILLTLLGRLVHRYCTWTSIPDHPPCRTPSLATSAPCIDPQAPSPAPRAAEKLEKESVDVRCLDNLVWKVKFWLPMALEALPYCLLLPVTPCYHCCYCYWYATLWLAGTLAVATVYPRLTERPQLLDCKRW